MDILVLPDHPVGPVLLAGLSGRAGHSTIDHPSGRPWIVGDWADHQIVQARVGDDAVVLLGTADTAPERLERAVAAAPTVSHLDQLATDTPGCFHLVARIDGVQRLQGSLSGTCRFAYCQVDGVTIAATRPGALAATVRAPLDDAAVALHLLTPYGPPPPLTDGNLWRGITVLPGGHYLRIEHDGTGRTTRWWTPPAPQLSFDAGVDAVRDTLSGAVDARTRGGGTISADLSGGMDSTSLCFLAARRDARLVTLHLDSLDTSNDNRRWADQYEQKLSPLHHVVMSIDDTPGLYGPSKNPDRVTDEPLCMIDEALVEHLGEVIAGYGSRLYLRGDGGDELFHPHDLRLHALVRRRPLAMWDQLRQARVMNRQTWPSLLRDLAPLGSYADWLRRVGQGVGRPPTRGREPLGWDPTPRMPAWATGDAVATARRRLLEVAATEPEPLAGLPVQHQIIRGVQLNGSAIRQIRSVTGRYGVQADAPFLDDRVVEAALSVRLEDRFVTGRVKPVLGAAMRGIAPPELADRTTKGHATAEMYDGLRRNHASLLALWEDSQLGRMGLADPAALQRLLVTPQPHTATLLALPRGLAVERWLRTVSQTASKPAVRV